MGNNISEISCEVHPIYKGFITDNTKTIIVGTFPPKKEYVKLGDDFFFYSSPRNRFWTIIDNIFISTDYKTLKRTNTQNNTESPLQNKLRKEMFMNSKNVGFIDIFSKITRKQDSSRDEDIIPLECITDNGILKDILINNYIKRICCVYKLAYSILKDRFINRTNEYSIECLVDNNTSNNEKLKVRAFDKLFEIILLYPAAWCPQYTIKQEALQYNHFIFS